MMMSASTTRPEETAGCRRRGSGAEATTQSQGDTAPKGASPDTVAPHCVTKPYKFIGFGAMDVTKPYKFIRFGAMDVTKTPPRPHTK